ncbi:NRDE family protein [Legionella bononiensis]|uniref:NRDE family protein n=1 Tax=Legionella bononiensis TaxID=2793102 RepID=A0ABS1WCF7_9GAMM|nr:NRDE family protein [Legionella bononiensis]MBL7478904.1 NRDE family protein [Legionella bononiensis]MBL7527036.1 NRDE family protein [Legionella bononiensis]MBL7562005.1 NRDE family protein [Legionella bononiensis]
MCLALIAIDQHPLFPLILLSNRDEFYKRSSTPADYWHDNPNIYSGKDLVGNGTWLGVHGLGHFSLVTNYRNPKMHQSSMRSRGHLVAQYLLESDRISPEDYLEYIKLTADQYNPFNLLVGTMQDVYYYSNVSGEIKKLSSGLYGLSNHLLDTPWYKVSRAKELFNNTKHQLTACSEPEQIIELLFPILFDTKSSPEHLLPETGIEHHLEQLLSSIYIDIPEYGYGTNQSSVVVFAKNRIAFSEIKIEEGRALPLKTTKIKPALYR